MDWKAWRNHFESNATRPLPGSGPWGDVPAREQLARSLGIFQLGEAGEGRIARQIWTASLPGIDDDYRVALGLFVKEEGRHARILAGLVKDLHGTLLTKTWTEDLFVAGRRLLGVRLKLLVLLAAEVVGAGFYGLLAEHVPAVREALLQLCADEERHLEFHADFFRTQTATAARRALFRMVWRRVGTAAALAVLLDHRTTLRALGVPVRVAAARLGALLAEAEHRSLGADGGLALAVVGVPRGRTGAAAFEETAT